MWALSRSIAMAARSPGRRCCQSWRWLAEEQNQREGDQLPPVGPKDHPALGRGKPREHRAEQDELDVAHFGDDDVGDDGLVSGRGGVLIEASDDATALGFVEPRVVPTNALPYVVAS